MRVLALASQKGGSGKTTLSGHLAVQAQLAGAGPVVLIDIDPQGSLTGWMRLRRPRPAAGPAAQRVEAARGDDQEVAVVVGRAAHFIRQIIHQHRERQRPASSRIVG